VPRGASPKDAAQLDPEIVFTLFCFHCDIRIFFNPKGRRARHHVAVAGFCSPSLEGANNSGATRAGLVTFSLGVTLK
jgi:hypothetical protein